MSRAQGINTNLGKILGLMISNGIVALASALYSHYQGFADVNMGRGAIVIGLAAVIISDVDVRPAVHATSRCKLVAVAIGAVIYYIVHTGGALAGAGHEPAEAVAGAGRGACSWPFRIWKNKARGCKEGRQATDA